MNTDVTLLVNHRSLMSYA